MAIRIKDQSIDVFLNALGSDAPAPGGGAAAGLSGALGAALGKMVTELTHGKQKYAAFASLAAEARERLLPLEDRMLQLADKDAAAYMQYMEALSMPKETEEQMRLRKSALQKAIRYATEVPCSVLETALSVITVLESLRGRSNATCEGDLAAGAAELSCAGRIAWLNILANLPYWADRDEAERVREDAAAKLASLQTRCDALYQAVEARLQEKNFAK